MLNCLPGRLQTNRVVPLAVDRCRVDFEYYYPAGDANGEELRRREQDQSFSDEVQIEDAAICEAVQRGLASGSYESGRLNPKREAGVKHFHDLLRVAYRQGLGAS
jgi:choline monooxygenase